MSLDPSTYTPELLAFGSNGGGEAFAFDMRFGVNDVIQIPFIGMDIETAYRIAPTFTDFLEAISRS
jgi:cell wall assembly regulator SMI1